MDGSQLIIQIQKMNILDMSVGFAISLYRTIIILFKSMPTIDPECEAIIAVFAKEVYCLMALKFELFPFEIENS